MLGTVALDRRFGLGSKVFSQQTEFFPPGWIRGSGTLEAGAGAAGALCTARIHVEKPTALFYAWIQEGHREALAG